MTTPAHRTSSAFRRIGAAVGAMLVQDDDRIREERHGTSVDELQACMDAFANRIENAAARIERAAHQR